MWLHARGGESGQRCAAVSHMGKKQTALQWKSSSFRAFACGLLSSSVCSLAPYFPRGRMRLIKKHPSFSSSFLLSFFLFNLFQVHVSVVPHNLKAEERRTRSQ